MEREIAGEITGDSLVDYDIEVHDEGEAISEYWALISTTG